MTLVLDCPRFSYRGAECRLRIYRSPGKPAVVIVSELCDNSGTSITNAAEGLATVVVATFRLGRPYRSRRSGDIGEPFPPTWIEHYPAVADCPPGGTPILLERWSRVEFAWTTDRAAIRPRWSPLTAEELAALLAGAPAPFRRDAMGGTRT